jgi:hypothetical protein
MIVPESSTLPLFRRGRWYTSLDTAPVTPLGLIFMSLAPDILLRDDVREVRRLLSAPRAALTIADRRRILLRAIDLFVDGRLDVPPSGPQEPAAFQTQLLQSVGLPPALVRRWCERLRVRVDVLSRSADAERDDDALWLVSLPANTFMCLESCAAAILSAGALWVRPSTREPFAASRFVAALLAAGWPADRLGLYGVSHASLPSLVRIVDRATLYGGEDLERRFGGLAHVTVHGPGRAVAIVERDLDVAPAVAWLKPLVAGDGGRFCTNVGTILCLQSAEPIGRALAEELDAIVPGDQDWPLASAVSEEAASATANQLMASMRSGDRRLTRRPIASADGGRPYLAPTAILLDQPSGHPLIGVEYPFPIAALATIGAHECSSYASGARFVHRYGQP